MATRVVEGKKPYTGGEAIDIDQNKVISLKLRDENNLIIYDNGDDEIYVDLQLPDGITPTDAFPVGVTTGRAVVADGWDKAGTIICAKTTSGDNIKLLYADDGTLWIDNGTGTFKQIYFKADVDVLITNLINTKQNGVASATAPSNPSEGDLWYDSANDRLMVYDGTSWNLVGGGGSGSGDVLGPSSAVDGHLAVFDGASGKIIKDGGAMPTIPTNVSDFNNDAGYLTSSTGVTSVNGSTGAVTVQEFTPGTGTTGQILTKTANGYGYANAPVTSVNGSTGAVTVQETLVNQSNIKSVQGNSLLGSGDLTLYSSTTATLTVAGWSSSTQTVSVTGVTATNQVIVAPDPSDLDDYAEKGIYCSGQGSGTLTFTCDTTPTASITVNVLIMNL